MNTILKGVVGSTAYGLNHKDSDVDRLGIFAFDTTVLHGLSTPDESVVTKDPDLQMHEVGKFCRLALKVNTTVTELLWLDDYEESTDLGADLVCLGSSFLSKKYVRDSYLGYATSNLKKVTAGTSTEKNQRHLYRLLIQGYELYTTGGLTVRVSNPQDVINFGKLPAAQVQDTFKDYQSMFDKARSPLPDEPNTAAVERFLLKVRRNYYDKW